MVQLFTVSATSSSSKGGSDDKTIKLNERLQRFARPLGSAVIALGLVVLFTGIWRFFQIQSHLTRGVFPAARRIGAYTQLVLDPMSLKLAHSRRPVYYPRTTGRHCIRCSRVRLPKRVKNARWRK